MTNVELTGLDDWLDGMIGIMKSRMTLLSPTCHLQLSAFESCYPSL